MAPSKKNQTAATAKKGKSTTASKKDAKKVVESKIADDFVLVHPRVSDTKNEVDVTLSEAAKAVVIPDVSKKVVVTAPEPVEKVTTSSAPSVEMITSFYTATTPNSVLTFVGPKGEEDLSIFMNENPTATVQSHASFRAMMSVRDNNTIRITDTSMSGLTSFQNSTSLKTPPAKIKVEAGAKAEKKSGKDLFSQNKSSPKSVVGETIDLAVDSGTPVMAKPNLGALRTVSSPAAGAKMSLTVISSKFVTNKSGDLETVISIQFTTSRNTIVKQYWAMKVDILSTILSEMESSGQFNQGGFSLVSNAFSDIKSAQLRFTPYGLNVGQSSGSGDGERYPINAMYIVVKLKKGSIVAPQDEVVKIAKVIKNVVSAPWFEELFMDYANNNMSERYVNALMKPKEKFFSMLKACKISHVKDASLNCFLLDDVINSTCFDITGSYNSLEWSHEVRKMAYHDGIVPGEESEEKNPELKDPEVE